MVRSVNKVGKEFIMNLAIADLCVASFADPMCIVGVVKGEEWFQDKLWFCEFIASLCLTACFCAFLSLSLVSFNRFVYVCHNNIYDRIYTRTVGIGMCIFAWIAAFLFEFPNHLGWGDNAFDTKSHQCIWDRTASFSYTLTVSVGLIGTPLLLNCLCFVLIFCYIYRTKRNIYRLDVGDPDHVKKMWVETLRTSRTLFIVFLMFVVCWTPYTVVIALDVKDKLSTEIHLFTTLLAHLHSSSNFLIYTLCNKPFRNSVKVALFKRSSIRTSRLDGAKSTSVIKRSRTKNVSSSM